MCTSETGFRFSGSCSTVRRRDRPAFADVSIYQLLLVAGVALFASVLGGVAGYGTGALMPLVLVPMVGAEQVVPIIALAGMLTNLGRTLAFLRFVDWHRVRLVMIGAIPPCLVTRLRLHAADRQGRAARDRHHADADRAAALHAAAARGGAAQPRPGAGLRSGYGAAVGGTVGAGVMLLSLLMAAGLAAQAVIATDAVLSIVIGGSRLVVFGLAGAITRARRSPSRC